MEFGYPARLDVVSADEVVATFVDIPEVVTGGRNLVEARVAASDALAEAVATYLAHGLPLPAPRAASEGEEFVTLDPMTAARATVATELRNQGLSNVALARRMNKDEKVVRRILDGGGRVEWSTVALALRALGLFPALTVSSIAAPTP